MSLSYPKPAGHGAPLTCEAVARAGLKQQPKRSGAELVWHCPNREAHTHGDQHASLMVNRKKDVWSCFPCGAKGKAWGLAAFIAGLNPNDKAAVRAWLTRHKLLDATETAKESKAHTTYYNYENEDRELLYRICVRRTPGQRKQVWQERPDGKGGWIKNLDGVRRVPYRLPDLLTADVAAVHEGEGCCNTFLDLHLERYDRFSNWKITATTNSGGAGKWNPADSEHLAGKDVLVFPDNDEAGRKHAEDVLNSVYPHAKSVRLVQLPDLPPKGDICDWMRSHSVSDLIAEIERAPLWEPAADDSRPNGYSDDALTLKFTARHGGDLRYTAAWARWNIWTGSVWTRDEKLTVFNLARIVCRAAGAECGNQAAEKKIRSAQTVAAVERLARSDRRHAATVDQWDADPYLLNTPNGVVDLRTGELRPSQREYYLTKSTAISPDKNCATPLWLNFLGTVTNGDQSLIEFLQRMCGYCLTGSTIEHALFFLYGRGGNGKGVFLNTISGAMNSYATTAAIETFVESKNQNHPTDLAGLQGARLVVATETEEGRRWAESKLKILTGGDRIAARYMRQDFFTFTPAFKLLIAGNHKPGLRNVDEAMRRRFHLVPFTVTIQEKTVIDKTLTEKLRAEWPGILQWMIDGALAWQQDGLNAPTLVRGATEEYFDTEDVMGRWLEERTKKMTGAQTSSSDLFRDWRAWTDANGEYAGSQKRFSLLLIGRGYTKSHGNRGSKFSGIVLLPVMDSDGPAGYPYRARARDADNRTTNHHPSPQSQNAGGADHHEPAAAPSDGNGKWEV